MMSIESHLLAMLINNGKLYCINKEGNVVDLSPVYKKINNGSIVYYENFVIKINGEHIASLGTLNNEIQNSTDSLWMRSELYVCGMGIHKN